jgi:hypothetical protein
LAILGVFHYRIQCVQEIGLELLRGRRGQSFHDVDDVVPQKTELLVQDQICFFCRRRTTAPELGQTMFHIAMEVPPTNADIAQRPVGIAHGAIKHIWLGLQPVD